MTECTMIGSTEAPVQKGPIKFCKYIVKDRNPVELHRECIEPKDWDNIKLLYSDFEFDFMYAWNNGFSRSGYIYQGHWNDGVVE